MNVSDQFPFEYSVRARAFRDLQGPEYSRVAERRDRELEDFLAEFYGEFTDGGGGGGGTGPAGPPGPAGPTGPAGPAGLIFVQDTPPTPTAQGQTWFDNSTGPTGGTSWVAISEVPGAAGPLNWVQYAPGAKTDGVWQNYAPNLNNWVIGNGTIVSRYCMIGTTCFVYDTITFGSTSTYVGNCVLTLPVAMAVPSSFAAVWMEGNIGTSQTGGLYNMRWRGSGSTSTTAMHTIANSSTSFSQHATLVQGSPITFTTGSIMNRRGFYEVA